VRRKFTFGLKWLLLISVALSGCNLPQPTSSTPDADSQRQTEIAGILNPTQLNPPLVLPTLTPGSPAADTPAAPLERREGFLHYTTQQGDTLPALASRFGVPPDAIQSEATLSPAGLLPPGIQVWVPDVLEDVLPYDAPILPDSEVTYGPTVGDFDADAYAANAGGFLASYSEMVKDNVLQGPEIVQRVALETSTNPRLLLAFLEYRSGWVFGHPENAADDPYPIGFGAGTDTGLYKELMITAKILAQGFYGWRDGSRVELSFFGGGSARLSPGLNAGSAALMQLFGVIYPENVWEDHLFWTYSFLDFYRVMFGDTWARAFSVEPYLLDPTLQPTLTLPFAPGEYWSLTGGPHITWQTGTPWGALDFAPVTGEAHCAVSFRWVTAAAPGLVVRSERSVVALDLDGDGDEGTGWVLIYQHIAEKDRVAAGTWLAQDAPVGHPSCEGGQASGTHVHLARKFNGEWVGVGDPLPLVLSGWRAYAGERRYEGYLQKGDQIVNASPSGMSGSTIIRED